MLTVVQNELSHVYGALEDGRGQKFKPPPICQCIRRTEQRDASQINWIPLCFECASILDLGNSGIKHIEPYSIFFLSGSGWRCGSGTGFGTNWGCLKLLCTGIQVRISFSFYTVAEWCFVSCESTQPQSPAFTSVKPLKHSQLTCYVLPTALFS